MKEKMHLIQSLNYIGQKYELSRFLAAANNTDDLNQHMRYSVYSITELYVIRTDDLKLVKNENKHNELHILQVDVIRPDITPGNIKKIVNAIQRKVLYNVALILNYEDEWFQIAVPHIHSGRSSQI